MSHNVRNHGSGDFGQVPFPVLFSRLSAKENWHLWKQFKERASD